MLNDLALFFKGLKDVVSEPIRFNIVRRFCDMMSKGLAKRSETAANIWRDRDARKFMRACGVYTGTVAVSDDLDVSATELSRFCDKWMSVTQFRDPPGAGEWIPFTSEMHSVRVTMVKELQALAAKKLGEET